MVSLLLFLSAFASLFYVACAGMGGKLFSLYGHQVLGFVSVLARFKSAGDNSPTALWVVHMLFHVHATIGCGKQGFPSAQPYLSHTPVS